jgi:hypothetical protein
MGCVKTAATEEHRVGRPAGLSGKKAVFRQVYLGSRLSNVDRLEVGGVQVHQLEGPIEAREVFIQQLPTPEQVSWVKAHHQHGFGIGALVTLADLHVTVDEQLGLHMGRWKKQCSAALGLVAACLDERGTYRLLVENLIVYETDGSIAGVVDVAPSIRTFGPSREWNQAASDALEGLQSDDALRTACRWFLRAVVSGPGEAGLLWLATTIESLVNDPAVGKPAFDVKRIRQAFEIAGGKESELPLGIGRCAGLRAQIVHKGPNRTKTCVTRGTAWKQWRELCCAIDSATAAPGHCTPVTVPKGCLGTQSLSATSSTGKKRHGSLMVLLGQDAKGSRL